MVDSSKLVYFDFWIRKEQNGTIHHAITQPCNLIIDQTVVKLKSWERTQRKKKIVNYYFVKRLKLTKRWFYLLMVQSLTLYF